MRIPPDPARRSGAIAVARGLFLVRRPPSAQAPKRVRFRLAAPWFDTRIGGMGVSFRPALGSERARHDATRSGARRSLGDQMPQAPAERAGGASVSLSRTPVAG